MPVSPGRREAASVSLTDEQAAVVATDTATLQVNAFAGTGKTATLVAYAQARPTQRLLYLAFNKALQLEAQRRCPANVVTTTCHALAFRRLGKNYQHKLVAKLRPLDVIAPLGLSHYPVREACVIAFAVLEILNRFLSSAEVELSPALLGEAPSERLLFYAQRLWAMMCDPASPVGMVHDGYLKLFQLSQPSLSGFDTILFDEAQDANPAMLAMVVRQPIPKVFMGDRHQQIYGWRGAQNALALIQPTVARYLTQSFRLGPLIAALANVLLATYKGETVPLQGCRPRGEIGHFDERRPYTVIARTNAGVFDEAARRVQWRRPPRLHFIGGLQGYPFRRILDAWRLYAKRREAIGDPFLRAFPDFTTLEQLAVEVDDRELKQLCRVVRQYGHRLPTLVRQIEHHTVPDAAGAQVCLTTAHKTKGLEFDQVVLAEDFPSLVQTPLPAIDSEEVNLLYVAVTRTRDLLELNTPLREVLKAYQRQHEADSRVNP